MVRNSEWHNEDQPGAPGFFHAMIKNDTIAAVATPPGTGGIAVIRVSGKNAEAILRRVFSSAGPFEHGRMVYGNVISEGRTIDSGYAVLFRGPRSYTGEDTAELQVHGGPVTTAMVLEAVVSAGARPAEPGEFTKRAFLNGRMDLAQAQAVGDLIGALSETGARLALSQTRQRLRTELNSISDSIKDIVARTEAILEYPDEDIDEGDAAADAVQLKEIAGRLGEIAATFGSGRIIRDGLKVTLAGAPNAGKSSLFNALCGEDAAIVTATPGTTRDCLRQTIALRGTAVHLTDTAGIRATDNEIEREGVSRSFGAATESDLVLFLVDGSSAISSVELDAWQSVANLAVPIVCVVSKVDLPQQISTRDVADLTGHGCQIVHISTVTGTGIDELKNTLYTRSCADVLREETVLLSDLRQKEHLENASGAIQDAAAIFESSADVDCACIDLRDALREIGLVTGEYADEEIIDRIFSKFCLGK